MADFGIGTAANVVADNVATPIIRMVIQKVTDIIKMGVNVRHLNTGLINVQVFLRHIETEFQHQALPTPVQNHLAKMHDALVEVKDLIDRSEPEPRCFGCCSFRNPKLATDIRNWKTKFEVLLRDLEQTLSICASVNILCRRQRRPRAEAQIATAPVSGGGGSDRRSTSLRASLSASLRRRWHRSPQRQPQAEVAQIAAAPVSGRGGTDRRGAASNEPPLNLGSTWTTMESAQRQVQAWLAEAHVQARMVGIYGMGGLGKTVLLKLVYEHFKEVRDIFDVVIWLTISQNYQIEKLQMSIAKTLDLNLEGIFDSDTRKRKLSKLLGKKKFLLILDDLWCPIDLIDEIGIKFGNDKHSKVLMSSRNRKVISTMGASKEYTLKCSTKMQKTLWTVDRNVERRNANHPN